MGDFFGMRAIELRQLNALLGALRDDSDLMSELSTVQTEQIKGAAEAIRVLFAMADRREMEDPLNEG